MNSFNNTIDVSKAQIIGMMVLDVFKNTTSDQTRKIIKDSDINGYTEKFLEIDEYKNCAISCLKDIKCIFFEIFDLVCYINNTFVIRNNSIHDDFLYTWTVKGIH